MKGPILFTNIITSYVIIIGLGLPSSSLSASTNNNNNINNGIFQSPIPNLEPSLAASAAHGTVVAVRSYREPHDGEDDDGEYNGDDCVVILSYRPKPPKELIFNLTRSAVSDHVLMQEIDYEESSLSSSLIPILSRGSVKTYGDHQFGSKNDGDRRWEGHVRSESRTIHVLNEQSGLCLAMTGFASDVQHLVRVAAAVVSNHEYVYGGECPNAHMMVREELAPRIRNAAFVGGDRPFGVQALIIGQKQTRRKYDKEGDEDKLLNTMTLYTIDSSGNWKHWGGGATCIGKFSSLVRRELYKSLYQNHDHNSKDKENNDGANDESQTSDATPRTWTEALDIAMKAIFKAVDSASPGKRETTMEADHFDAIVIFGKGAKRKVLPSPSSWSSSRCAIIRPKTILDSYNKCEKALSSNTEKCRIEN